MSQKTKYTTPISYAKLSNKIVLRMASRNNIRILLGDFISNASERDFEDKFSRLIKDKKIQSALTAYSKDIQDFSRNGFLLEIPIKRALALYRFIIKERSSLLNKFVLARDEIEHAILFADYTGALKLLESLEAECGESIWLSRTKMLVLSAMEDNEAFQNYCDDCQSRSEPGFNAFILKAAQLIADSGNAVLQLGAVVHRQISELREAKQEMMSSLLQILFVPYPLEKDIDHSSCLPYLQVFPIIDLYTTCLVILKIELVKYEEHSEYRATLEEFAIEICKDIQDASLVKLCKLEEISKLGPTSLDGVPLEVYKNYKLGRYDAALKNFSHCSEVGESPLSFVNIAAKSIAYLSNENSVDIKVSAVSDLAQELAMIYRLSPLWQQAEEQVTSLCVKYNHLVMSSCVQLSLLKALPFRYSPRSQAIAARMAIASAVISTPQTYILATDGTCKLENMGCPEDMPRHRLLKNSIMRHLSESIISSEFIKPLLDQLVQSDALEKDVIECSVTYFLKTGNDTELLKLTTEHLTFDGNRYICLPMEHLVDTVESHQLADLDAVILCYFYNKNISDERDNLLNETFNEYLLSTGSSKPSQLLRQIEEPNAKQKLFFRDICVPDIMDYLGCFKTSNELRAERLIMLDGLEELGAIDPKERMREVEDIVRQVIVDTGISEFNSAKIFVNEAVLRKKHSDEIASLISIYKKIPENSEERFTPLDHESSGAVYLSGSKNSVAEKIYSIVCSSYLFDDKYGLDKNLSGEIRHGYFSNLMRARLEEHNLLTELDDKGRYLPNLYWRERNLLIKSVYWEEIDSVLMEFSREFDQLISEAEEWMKISFQSKDNQRMFAFVLILEDLERIKDVLSISEESDGITSFVLSLLSKRTDAALTAVRERLNGEFKGKIDLLFEKTYNQLVTARGEAALLDLMNSLVRVRNEIQEDIHSASLWFQKNQNSEISAGTLDRLVEIAVRSFEKVRGNAYVIHIKTPAEFSAVPVDSRIGKPFILAIINLLDNCYTHSGLRQATQVSIFGELSGAIATLTIANNLSSDKQLSLDQAALNTIREKLADSDMSVRIRDEGGTGLIKASHEITYLGMRSDLSVNICNGSFLASIAYDYSEATS